MDSQLRARMSKDAQDYFVDWAKNKSKAVVEKMMEKIDAASIKNRNARVFMETVKKAVKQD